jgi:hypothetical protein
MALPPTIEYGGNADSERHTVGYTVDDSNGANEEDVTCGSRSDGKAFTTGNKDKTPGSSTSL